MENKPDDTLESSPRARDAWAYALRVYARPGVSSACLLLQDEFGLDVLVMLHLAHTAVTNGAATIKPGDVERADACARDWRDHVIRPLRAVRHAISKDDPATAALRADVQRIELMAERVALAQLVALPASDTPSRKGSQPAHSVDPIVRFYALRNDRAALLDRHDVAQAMTLLNKALFA